MSENKFSVDSILEELAAKGTGSVPTARRDADTLVDDILAGLSGAGKTDSPAVSQPIFQKEESAYVQEEVPAQPVEQPEPASRPKRKRGGRKPKEEPDPLADITPWHERHTEAAEGEGQGKNGAKDSQDFLDSLKVAGRKPADPVSHLLYKSGGGFHPTVEPLVTAPAGPLEEVSQEALQQQVQETAEQMESTYEPTRCIPAKPTAAPSGAVGDSPTIAIPVSGKGKADELTGQVRLPGFDAPEQPAAMEEADSWEGDFLAGREEKISDFHMQPTAPEEDDKPQSYEDDGDYHSPQDASEVKFDLLARRRSATLRMVITFGLFVFTVLLTVVDRFDVTNGLLGDNPGLTMGLYVGSLTACILLNLRMLWGGFAALFKGCDQDTPAAIGMVLALLQVIGVIIVGGSVLTARSFSCFMGCAAQLGVFMNLWGKRILFTRMYRNFELVGNNRVKRVVTKVADRQEAFELGRGLAIGSPQVVFSAKGVDMDGFVYHSYAPDLVETSARIPVYLLPVFGILGGVFSFFFLSHGDTATAVFHVLSGVVGCMQIALPVSLLLGGNLPFRWFGKRLRSQKIMLSGYDGITEFKDTDVLALDASDLFPAGTITLKSIKSASNQSLDRSIMDVAGVVYLAESPLKPLFETIIQGKTDLLPNVDTLVYEEEMGISGWVMGYRVLVGTKKLMENHGVSVPDIDYEEKYNEFGLKTVYLSTQGVLSAIFLVKYTPSARVMAGLQRAVKEGMSLHIYSCDPNITKELVCKMFRLPSGSVRIMGAVPRRLYKQQTENTEVLDGILSYEGNAGTFCHGVCAVKKLYRVLRFSAILQSLFVVLGVVAFCTGLYLMGSTGVSGVLLAAYHGVSAVISAMLTRMMGR